MERAVWMDEACSTSLLVSGVEGIIVHKLPGKELNCFYCKQKGHIVERCQNRIRSKSRGVNQGPQPNRADQRGYPGQQRSGNLHQLEDVGIMFMMKRLGGGMYMINCFV